MLTHLNEQEIQNIAYDLSVSFARLSGNSLDAKVISLIQHCHQRGLTEKLVDKCIEMNDYATWR